MRRLLIAMLFAAPWLFDSCTADAQAPRQGKSKGFSLPPANAVIAPSVVRAPAKPTVVKIIEVDAVSEVSDAYRNCTAGIETVEVLSNGTMRWHFYIMNRGDNPKDVLLDMKGTSVSDTNGETYDPIAAQFPRTSNGVPWFKIKSGQKFRFWLLYTQPAAATNEFKVNVLPEFEFNRTFKPFAAILPDPVGPDAKTPDPVPFTTNPGTTIPAPPPTPTEPTPTTDAPPGPTYEGDAKINDSHGIAGIVFTKPLGDDENIEARLYSSHFKSLRTELSGRKIEDDTRRDGITYVLVSPKGLTVRLRLDGNLMSGTDSNGGRYSFYRIDPPSKKLTRR